MKLTTLTNCIIALAVTATTLPAQDAKPKSPGKITLHVEADYLALHVSGTCPKDASALEYRLTLASAKEPGPWTPVPTPDAEGKFKFDVALPEWRWRSLELRAQSADHVELKASSTPKEHPFTMLTAEALAKLPEGEQAAWKTYLATSAASAARERDLLAAECRKLNLPISQPAPHNGAEFEMDDDLTASWYASAEVQKIADALISYQTPTGGWSKAISYAEAPRTAGMHWTNNAENPWHYCGTLDNRSTTEQIRFLANVFTATKREDAKASALRGIEWLLAAQYPNGGWPQNYPVEPGYHEAITLNDNAMVHALEVLLEITKGEAPFEFIEPSLRERAAKAFDKGIACLLACQVRQQGKPTVWCAQHHPLTLVPVAARLKEPPSLSGGESGELLKFFMRKAPIRPDITASIEAGVAWLAANRVTGLRKTKNDQGKTDYVADPASTEVYWARFYDIETGKPIFSGAQDGVIYNSFSEMAQHNKVSYDYFTTKPADVIGKEVERWKKRMQKAKK
jgi:PelA/Pel-15E family pectate lyase